MPAMKKRIFLLAALFCILTAFTSFHPDDILGVWKNGTGKGHIQIYKQGTKYYGKIIWLKDGVDPKGQIKKDQKNPDPALRNRPIVGLTMLKNFYYDDDDSEWTDGRIYNPSDGKEYKAYIKMADRNTLTVRGYVGISLFGKSDTWTRVR
jgi:uncharacterized protein (DUF2147 family)